jgi:hypothetical protein
MKSKEASMTETAPIPMPEDIHTSMILRRLIDEAPANTFTLKWMVGHLPNRSFGVILLFLSIVALLPIISIPARLLIMALTFEIIIGYHAPVLPKRWMKRHLPSHYLPRLEHHVIPLLEHLEVLVRPRWCPVLTRSRRFAAVIGFLLCVLSLLEPLPLANMPAALICVLISLSFIEHDGMLLAFSYVCAIVLLVAPFVVIQDLAVHL